MKITPQPRPSAFSEELRARDWREALDSEAKACGERVAEAERETALAWLEGRPADITRLATLRDELRSLRAQLRIADRAVLLAQDRRQRRRQA